MLLLTGSMTALGQDRFVEIRQAFDALSREQPGLNEQVELSVSGVPLQEFIRGLASANNLNVSVNPGLKGSVVNNFANATVKDVFLYLCREYGLEVQMIGSIIAFREYAPPPVEPEVKAPRV
ncbi:MAG: hypothetical protein AAGB22_14470, partial [Bacteroidota bacterium]